jgi:hypothetical protein
MLQGRVTDGELHRLFPLPRFAKVNPEHYSVAKWK